MTSESNSSGPDRGGLAHTRLGERAQMLPVDWVTDVTFFGFAQTLNYNTERLVRSLGLRLERTRNFRKSLVS